MGSFNLWGLDSVRLRPPPAPAQRGEYVQYVRGATIIRKLNPWDVGGRNPTEKAVLAVELLREITRDIAEVSSASSALFLRELVKLYRERDVPSTKDVIDRMEAFLKTAMSDRRMAEANMASAILRRLHWLQVDEERTEGNTLTSESVTIYDLSTVRSNYVRTLYAISILTKKYYEARGLTDELAEVIIAEEAQNYVRARRPHEPPSIGERLVNELRAYGVGVVLVAPDPEQIPPHLPRDVGAVVAIGAHALPEFLERMRHDYRKGMIGKTNSTFVFHNNKLTTARKPRPPKTITVAEAPTGTW